MPGDWHLALDGIVRDMHERRPGMEYDLQRIMRAVNAPSPDVLAEELTKLIQSGELAASYRVLSPETRSGLGEYDSILDIPVEMYDDTTDHHFIVVPSRDLEIIYRTGRA